MKFGLKIALIAVGGFSAGFGGIYFSSRAANSTASNSGSKANDKPTEIDWAVLRELDLASGKASDNLKKLENSTVRLPGFMIPLEDNQTMVSEFLLVPSPMACVHVPSPPANQIVHVKMGGGQRTKMSFGPIWLQGRLRISEVNGPYGKSSFEIAGELTEPFQ